jgi:hypothetical protein
VDTNGPRRILVTFAPTGAFAPMTRTILTRLGYVMLDPEEFESSPISEDGRRPDLHIVDERSLAEVPEDGGPPVPIIALTGRHGVSGADSRIVGAVRRPAGMHELYRLAQEALEETPRTTPRVPTHIAARCRRRQREWMQPEWTVAVLSLSENGCLVRSSEPLLLGAQLVLRFELPRRGVVELDGEVSYQLVPDFGLVFHATAPADRATISSFIAEVLTTSPGSSGAAVRPV